MDTDPPTGFCPYAQSAFQPVFDWMMEMEGVNEQLAILYGTLAAIQGKGRPRPIFPGIELLCERTHAPARTVRRRLQKLEALGLIVRDPRPGRSTVYTLTPPPHLGAVASDRTVTSGPTVTSDRGGLSPATVWSPATPRSPEVLGTVTSDRRDGHQRQGRAVAGDTHSRDLRVDAGVERASAPAAIRGVDACREFADASAHPWPYSANSKIFDAIAAQANADPDPPTVLREATRHFWREGGWAQGKGKGKAHPRHLASGWNREVATMRGEVAPAASAPGSPPAQMAPYHLPRKRPPDVDAVRPAELASLAGGKP